VKGDGEGEGDEDEDENECAYMRFDLISRFVDSMRSAWFANQKLNNETLY
jgi:hypothetical protein